MSDADRALARALAPPRGLRPIAAAEVPAAARLAVHRAGRHARPAAGGQDRRRLRPVARDDLERFVSRFRALDLGATSWSGGSAFVQHDIVGSVDHDGPRATRSPPLGAVLVVLAVLGPAARPRSPSAAGPWASS